MHHSSDLATTMVNSRRHNRLPLILAPSPPSSAVTHAQSRPLSSGSFTNSHKEGSQPIIDKSWRRSLRLLPSTSLMNPLLPGPTTSGLPIVASIRTTRGPEPFMYQLPPREEPRAGNFTPHHRATSSWEKQAGLTLSAVESNYLSLASTRQSSHELGARGPRRVTEPPTPKRPSAELFVSTPAPTSPNSQRFPHTSRNRAKLKRRSSADVTPTLDRITLSGGVEPKPITTPANRPLWTYKTGPANVVGDEKDGEPLSRVNTLPECLAEKKRVMNVRRAKKMQQVRADYSFGPHFFRRGLGILIHLLRITGFRLGATAGPFPDHTHGPDTGRRNQPHRRI